MENANMGQLREKLAEYLAYVEEGGEVEVRKRNVPVARIIPVKQARRNKTVLGCGRGTGKILGSLTDPFIPESDWEMLT